eukprot:scaffold9728_cov132-Isochrysis_galbana.AAC.3
MRPLGAVRARADKARDRHDRKCLEGSLNMTGGHTIKHRHMSHPRFSPSSFCSLGSAKNRPITDTDA